MESGSEVDRLLSGAQVEQVINLARQAGRAILEIYNAPNGFEVARKLDESVFTQADLESNRILVHGLQLLEPLWPVLSEECPQSHASDIRQQWPTLWMIDPLDGTKDFVHRTGEFAINIALVDQGKAHWGLVYSPVLETAWHGGGGYGSYVRYDHSATDHRIHAQVPAARPLRALVSRNHHGGAEHRILAEIDRDDYGPAQSLQHGSSIKYCKIAEGQADFMPRLHPCMEWDTAAPQAILEGAGGQVLTTQGQALTYNSRTTLLNGNLVALADPALPWQQWLEGAQ